MRILFCGDVVGKTGRKSILEHVPRLREEWKLDFVIVNGENAAHGFGITEKICKTFYDAGVDVITTGNHVWDQKEVLSYIKEDERLLRPLNYAEGSPGNGAGIFEAADGRKVMVIHPMGRLFMELVDDPFKAVDRTLDNHRLGVSADCIVVDIHAEATSEKMAMGHYLDGRVSMVVGSHSHVPTADAQILPGGTAYQTDLGMCGDYDSVIGMQKQTAVDRFVKKVPGARLEPAVGDATLCGVLLETDDETGLAQGISPVRIGGRLAGTTPDAGTAVI
ncbi:MAG: TIGR00282 family metallophosphoesterase [Rhodospirillaceae bacterium]|jgi:metallophosphoesterase (TIGR00282 family)